jgi:methionyl-tRNA synthetase
VPLPNAEGKVLYVWFDAPIGYISATRAFFDELSRAPRPAKGQGSVPSPAGLAAQFATPQRDFGNVKADDWKTYWQDKETKLVHFIGKDNIVFHCIIFPVMLQAHGDYILPDNVPANEFLNLEGDKMSTSRGWSIEMHEYLEDFPTKPDELRYALLTNLPEAKDSEFTWKDFQAKNNNELVAIFGNFVNRALVLTQKNFDNKVPALGTLTDADKKLLDDLKAFPARIASSLETYRFREATALMIDLARLGNKYLADTEPWKLIKTDAVRVGTILNIALQIAANLTIVAKPFLPYSADKLAAMLKAKPYSWKDAGSAHLLTAGDPLGDAALLFEKIEDDVITRQLQKLNDKKKSMELEATPATPAKPEITYDDFAKMDIRVGTVVKAEKMEKSKKLLKLQVDTGLDTRTILSGIAEHYTPDEMVGKQVTLLVNLAPRKMMGIESQGMILMAEDKDGKLRLVQPSVPVSNGSGVS